MKKIISALFVAALALVSCSEKVEEGKDQTAYYIDFVNETDASLVFTPDFAGTYEIALDTNVPKAKLKLTDDGVQTWCSADLNESGDAILITPGHAMSADLSATFVLEAVGLNVAPLTFEVKRLYQEVEHEVKIFMNGEVLLGEYPMCEVSGNQSSQSVVVRTTASRWMMSYDYYSDESQWFSSDKSSGANGETCTFTFEKNASGLARSQTFVFKPGFAGTDVSVSLTFIQKAWSAIESVVVRSFDNGNMTAGDVIADRTAFTLPNGNTSRTPFCFVVEVVGKGSVDVRFAAPDSDRYYAYDDESVWMFGGASDIDPEDESKGKYYRITTLGNSTGAPRSMDAVLTDANGVELFRFRFTQE